MLVQMFKAGQGSGKGPTDYLTDDEVKAYDPQTRQPIKDPDSPTGFKMKTRVPPPELLKGDTELTCALIDSSPNKWRYSSGVIAFADDDAPTPEQIEAVIADFEATVFAGLAPDQYNSLWVKHTHEGNTELHFVVPRLELSTGKALNIAPPGYEKMFDAWRDKWNFSMGWADPQEQTRKRLIQDGPSYQLKLDAEAVRTNMPKAENPRQLMSEYLFQRLANGQIETHADVLASIAEVGCEVTRNDVDKKTGTPFLSFRPEPEAKPIRLKGALFDKQFNLRFERVEALRQELGLADRPTEVGDSSGRQGHQGRDPERVRTASAELAELVEKRRGYHLGRYQKPSDTVLDRNSGLDEGQRSPSSGNLPSRGQEIQREPEGGDQRIQPVSEEHSGYSEGQRSFDSEAGRADQADRGTQPNEGLEGPADQVLGSDWGDSSPLRSNAPGVVFYGSVGSVGRASQNRNDAKRQIPRDVRAELDSVHAQQWAAPRLQTTWGVIIERVKHFARASIDKALRAIQAGNRSVIEAIERSQQASREHQSALQRLGKEVERLNDQGRNLGRSIAQADRGLVELGRSSEGLGSAVASSKQQQHTFSKQLGALDSAIERDELMFRSRRAHKGSDGLSRGVRPKM